MIRFSAPALAVASLLVSTSPSLAIEVLNLSGIQTISGKSAGDILLDDAPFSGGTFDVVFRGATNGQSSRPIGTNAGDIVLAIESPDDQAGDFGLEFIFSKPVTAIVGRQSTDAIPNPQSDPGDRWTLTTAAEGSGWTFTGNPAQVDSSLTGLDATFTYLIAEPGFSGFDPWNFTSNNPTSSFTATFEDTIDSNLQNGNVLNISINDPTPVPLESDALPVVVGASLFGLGLWTRKKIAQRKAESFKL